MYAIHNPRGWKLTPAVHSETGTMLSIASKNYCLTVLDMFAGTRVRDSTGKLINADQVRGTNPAIGNARLSQPLVRDSVGVKRVSSQNQTGAAGGADRKGVVQPLKEVVDRVAN